MVIPNAITLVLAENNEKHFFTSFSSRDKTYTTLFKLWQISILDHVSSLIFYSHFYKNLNNTF